MEKLGLLKHRLDQHPGKYECHITVEINASEIDTFRLDCEKLGGSAIVIELSGGDSPVQPMLAKQINGYEVDAYVEVLRLTKELGMSYKVTRVKVEACVSNDGVPESDEIASALPEACYFEHHVRMVLPFSADLEELKALISSCGAHLSKNAILKSNEFQHRFATQRVHSMGNEHAAKKLELLLDLLSSKGITVDKVIREFNIYDSNKDLDKGWENG